MLATVDIMQKESIIQSRIFGRKDLARPLNISAGESAGSLITYGKEFSIFHELGDIFIIKTNEEGMVLQLSLWQ